MQLTIQDKKENVLLNRREIKAALSFEKATPSNKDVAESIAKQMNVDAGLVVIKHIYNTFSLRQAKVDAVIYDTQETRERVERINGHLRKKLEDAVKKTA